MLGGELPLLALTDESRMSVTMREKPTKRIVTCGVAGVIAFAGFRDRPVVQAWSVLLALVAVLFNPFIPVHLARQTWFYLDLAAAAVFVAHLILVRWSSTVAPAPTRTMRPGR